MYSPKPYKYILNTFIPLRQALDHFKRMQAIQKAVVQYMPQDCANHIVFVQLDGASLVLHADSPEWSSRIRFLLPDILRSIQIYNNYQYIKEIRLRVVKRPASAPYFTKKAPKSFLFPAFA